MFNYVFTSFKGYKLGYLKDDIPAGIIVAALTIPVAMGYAQVAGLPPIYGLYASLLPVLGYILFASSPQLVFGIDAGSAAITGSALAVLGITAGSAAAVAAAPVLALFAGIFLVLFGLLRLGRFSEFISRPVMSGFISGISLSIIFGQLPKIAGISPSGSGFFDNVAALVTKAGDISLPSVALGAITAALILVGKRFFRKVPVALIVLVLGTFLSWLLDFAHHGVAVVGTIPEGFPPFALPDILHLQNYPVYIGYGFAAAIVIFASSILAADSFAERGGYEIKPNRELFAYGVSSLLAAINGCPPTSGSVSRTAASLQFRAKTQMVSVVSVLLTALVVAFLGGVLYYMPQPVLGGIVLAAMLGVVELSILRSLLHNSRAEALTWVASALGVLLVGVLFGVLIGIILSFVDIIVHVSAPPRAFLGVIPGRSGFFNLKTHKQAKALPQVVIYRFSARLLFANVKLFVDDIKKEVSARHPKLVVFDAAGINGIDDTAAEELKILLQTLEKQNIRYCFAGQIDRVRRQMDSFGLAELVGGMHTAKTVSDALLQNGISLSNMAAT